MEGGSSEAGRRDACVPSSGPELCNHIDDDCDGKLDEDTEAACAAVIANGKSSCVPFHDTASCVLLECLPGFENCDGNPANGCEPFCSCHSCPEEDAGSEDAGPSSDAG